MLKTLISKQNGKILIVGKSNYFTFDEMKKFLTKRGFEVVKDYEDGVIATIESSRLNTIEEDISDKAYSAKVPKYDMKHLEKLMSDNLKVNETLMALKLSKDRDRLIRLLQNEYIDDEFFIKLLSLYEWRGEELLDDDDDRYVYWALMERFLHLGTYERDALYSPATLLKLINTTDNPNLLDILLNLPHYEFRLRGKQSITIPQAVAMRDTVLPQTIKTLFNKRDKDINICLALNPAIDDNLMESLVNRDDKMIDEALARNTSLSNKVFKKLLNRVSDELKKDMLKNKKFDKDLLLETIKEIDDLSILSEIASNLNLDKEMIDILIDLDNKEIKKALAKNPSIDTQTAQKLYSDKTLHKYLALNPSMPKELIREIYKSADSETIISLAQNPATPEDILRKIYQKQDYEYLKALAKNRSTPMDILHQLKTDHSLWLILQYNEKFVKEANKEMGMR